MPDSLKFAIALIIVFFIYPPLMGLFFGLGVIVCIRLLIEKIVNDFT